MTPWKNRVTELARRMADDMKLRNFSQSTIDAYTYHVGKFAEFLGKSPLEATAEDVRSFQLHMLEVRKLGWSSFNQAVCGLRFFFRTSFPSPESHRLATSASVAELAAATEQQQPAEDSIRVFDLLRRYTADFVKHHRPQAVPQVQCTLTKLELCRTAALGGHLYRWDPCDFECRVNNSCADR